MGVGRILSTNELSYIGEYCEGVLSLLTNEHFKLKLNHMEAT